MEIINSMQAGLHSFFTEIQGIGLALGVVIAFLNCFFGYRLLKLWCVVIGFLVGAITTFAVCTHFAFTPQVSTIAAVVAGAVLAFVSFKIYLAGVFVLCGGASYLAYAVLVPMPASGAFHWALLVLGILLSIAVGVLGIKFARPAVVFSTAISGGLAATAGLLGFFGVSASAAVTLAGVALAVLGVFVQLRTAKK